MTASDKLDKNGNIIKTTSFEFIYPDTIVPPVTEEETPVNNEETMVSDKESDNESTESTDEL